MDQQGVIIAWNASAEAMFGWRSQEVVGKPLSQFIIPFRHRASHAAGISHFNKSGEGPVLNTRIKIEARRRDGMEFPVELSIIPIGIEKETVFYGFLRSLEEQERSQRIIAQRSLQAEILSEVSQKLLEDSSSDDLTRFCLQKVCEVAGWPVGHLYHVDDAVTPPVLRPSSLWHIAAERYQPAVDISRALQFRVGEGFPGRVWARQDVVSIEDVRKETDFARQKSFVSLGLLSGLAFPIWSGGKVVAVMEFFGPSPRSFDETVLSSARIIGGHISLVLERKEAAEKRDMLRRELAHRVGNSMAIISSVFRNCSKSAETVAELRDAFEGRLMAISRAHRHLSDDTSKPSTLYTILADGLSVLPDQSRCQIAGVDLSVAAPKVLPLTLVMHELTMNSLKHGAAGENHGQLSIAWTPPDEEGAVEFMWQEKTSGARLVQPGSGYGTVLIKAMIEKSLKGSFSRDITAGELLFRAKLKLD